MNFIKKIFQDKVDEIVHKQFARFGKGEYERAYVNINKSKKNFRVKTSFDFANDFVGMIAENAKENLNVSGFIIENYGFEKELRGIVDVEDYSKRGNLHKASINVEINSEKLKEIYETFKFNFLLLNAKSKNYKLTVKKNLPKPGGKIIANFCSATLPLELINEFAFDVKEDFKKLNIKHIFIIDELIILEEFKNDLKRAREEAKRKGKIIRILNVDGKKIRKEKEIEV